MKKIALIALITVLAGAPVFAQNGGFVAPAAPAPAAPVSAPAAPAFAPAENYPQAGGFAGPGTGATTVKQARRMPDDRWVTLQGYIDRRIGVELYEFRDETGTINVDIDYKYWRGQTIQPTDRVEIRGEIDNEWDEFHKPVEVDVKQLIKLTR